MNLSDDVQKSQKIEVIVRQPATLRQWFSRYYPYISYNRLQQAIRAGDIKVNKKRESPQKELLVGDKISFWQKLAINNEETQPKRKPHPCMLAKVRILEANEDFWVIDKPYGISSQGGSKIKISLIEILEEMMQNQD